MAPNTQEAVRQYLEHGYAAIPIPTKSKNPNRQGWQKERWTVKDVARLWNDGQNVGVLCGSPSGGRVDVDCDCPEAVRLAPRFLPPTLTSGRETVPHSHWWYRSPGIESRAFRGISGEILLEIRADGRQTVVYPSVHPDGDSYVWHRETGLEIGEVNAVDLTCRVRELASAILIARNLPPVGGRHNCTVPLVGFLLRRLDTQTVRRVVHAAYDAVGYEEDRDAHRNVDSAIATTAEKLEREEPTTGGPTLDELVAGLPRAIAKIWEWDQAPPAEDAGGEEEPRRNQADRLIEYARTSATLFFVDENGAPHALVGKEPTPLNSRCYSWLRKLMFDQEGRSCSGEALKSAAGTLAAFAEFSGSTRELHTRAAWHDGAVYFELGPGRVVRIAEGGYSAVADSPVLFRRFANLKPLPDPEPGGSLDDVSRFFNVKTARGRRLLLAYLVTLPLPHIPRPILNTTGTMGSGKTTLARLVKRLIDPTTPEFVRVGYRDFLQKAAHAYILALDNQSVLSEETTDTLCRLVTGEADSKRRLYSDDDDIIYQLRRAVLLNAINPPTDRADLLDRSLMVELDRIPSQRRFSEEELWKDFEDVHPHLLGALFETLAKTIKAKNATKLSRKPRLADWGEYAAAAYGIMGFVEEDGKAGAELFLEDWEQVVKVQNQATIEGSPVALAIITFMKDKVEHSDASSGLHAALEAVAGGIGIDIDREREWPKSSRWLWRRIKEVIPALEAVGIAASKDRSNATKQITFRKARKNDGTDGTEEKTRWISRKPVPT